MIAFLTYTDIIGAKEKSIAVNLRGGVNFSTYAGDLHKTKTAVKQQFGLGLDLEITDNLYLLTGLDYHTKGSKGKSTLGQTIKYNPAYLQIPLHAAYKIQLSPDFSYFLGTGWYAAYGVGGRIKIKGGEKVNIFNKGRLKKFDMGTSIIMGVKYKRNVFKIGYDFGFINISDIKGTKVRNRNFFITSGYRFGR